MVTRLLLLLGILVFAAGVRASDPPEHADQVVTLTITYQTFDPRRPWAKSAPRAREAMAVVVAGPRLLTSAQMVADATLIRVQKFGGPPDVPARTVHVDSEVNLALLAVDDPGFFADLRPVEPATALPTGGSVRSVRWKGGQLEVSTSRVARIEVASGPTSDLEHVFLRVKSDLAAGGWAEPSFLGDRLVGITVGQDEEFASVLPAEVVRAYLEAAAAEGPYPGFAKLGFSWQPNRDPALSSFLGLSGEPRGVLILRVPWGSSGWGVLQPRDLLLAIDGHPIDSEGYYRHPRYGRLRCSQLAVEGRLAGDALPVRILRDGAEVTVTLALRRYPVSERLIPWGKPGQPPGYLVAGGLVFRELDLPYLSSWGEDWWNSADPLLTAFWELERDDQTPTRRRTVLLMYVLPTAYTMGYHDLANLVVARVNGQPVDRLQDLAEAFRHPAGRFHRIAFRPNPVRTQVILDAASLTEATEEVLQAYGIPQAARLDPAMP